jgi:ATP-dependent Clp protease ATP-binding subunit ClpC
VAAATIGPKMFERYTERARRILFFARYEAVQLGSPSIETEHLLLGLIREGKGLTSEIFARAHLPLEAIRSEIERSKRPRLDESVEIRFSPEVQLLLNLAPEEADRLNDYHVGSEHLLLGLLRGEGTVAGSILASNGLRLDAVRQEIATLRGVR